jgi:glycosyltransferase involved in cell wall biosynthesis
MDLKYSKENIEILVVNFNTPDLIERLLDSWIKFGYSSTQIHIIDGSNTPQYQTRIKEVCKNVKLTQFGYNIHHGPGLDFGIKQSSKEYLFLMDSDSFFTESGLFDILQFPEDHFGVGFIVRVDSRGVNSREGQIRYLHPNCCLISKEKYLMSSPLIRHGAPFIDTMTNMKFLIKDESELIKKYIYFGGRGTVGRFGSSIKKK